jgi:hypothetical protein
VDTIRGGGHGLFFHWGERGKLFTKGEVRVMGGGWRGYWEEGGGVVYWREAETVTRLWYSGLFYGGNEENKP